MANGSMVATATKKTIVNPTNRMVNAISLGVFCRRAPSTSEIIRSRKVSPGFAVTLTFSQSDKTLVPPVTDDLSPPDSRMTGADSPVTALSSTEAIPSTTSPSLGITSPASTRIKSPLRRLSASTTCIVSLSYFFARVWLRVPRNALACAFPLPSAIASAKLANNTVNQSQRLICRVKNISARFCRPISRNNRIVVIAAPTHTINMTGLRTCMRGFSL